MTSQEHQIFEINKEAVRIPPPLQVFSGEMHSTAGNAPCMGKSEGQDINDGDKFAKAENHNQAGAFTINEEQTTFMPSTRQLENIARQHRINMSNSPRDEWDRQAPEQYQMMLEKAQRHWQAKLKQRRGGSAGNVVGGDDINGPSAASSTSSFRGEPYFCSFGFAPHEGVSHDGYPTYQPFKAQDISPHVTYFATKSFDLVSRDEGWVERGRPFPNLPLILKGLGQGDVVEGWASWDNRVLQMKCPEVLKMAHDIFEKKGDGVWDKGTKGGFKKWLSGVGVTLILWDLFLGLPISYIFTILNREIFRFLGHEKIMRSPSGINGSRILFILINTVLVVSWAIQLVTEKKNERIHKLKIENERMRLLCDSLEREKFAYEAEAGEV